MFKEYGLQFPFDIFIANITQPTTCLVLVYTNIDTIYYFSISQLIDTYTWNKNVGKVESTESKLHFIEPTVKEEREGKRSNK